MTPDNSWVRFARNLILWVVIPFMFGVTLGLLFEVLLRG